MRVQHPARDRSIPIPGSVHGYIETPIYAKTPGYLKAIYVDKGDRVRKGQVLAVLESPELDKQVADAKANYWLQKVTDVRNQKLVAEEVIPQQSADNSHAALLQAKAAYEQLVALQSYEVIRAETDGIIHRSIRRSGRPDCAGDLARRQHTDRGTCDAPSAPRVC
jgi:multidrug efflux pump subunit AcrA (membrane-fusion protein)